MTTVDENPDENLSHAARKVQGSFHNSSGRLQVQNRPSGVWGVGCGVWGVGCGSGAGEVLAGSAEADPGELGGLGHQAARGVPDEAHLVHALAVDQLGSLQDLHRSGGR